MQNPKNIDIDILGLELANALSKVQRGITFVEIEYNFCHFIIKVDLLYINLPILILE